MIWFSVQIHCWWSWTIYYYIQGNRSAFLHEKIRNWKRHIHMLFEDISYISLTFLVYIGISIHFNPLHCLKLPNVLWMRVINLSEFCVLESWAGENYYKTVMYRSHVFIVTLFRAAPTMNIEHIVKNIDIKNLKLCRRVKWKNNECCHALEHEKTKHGC